MNFKQSNYLMDVIMPSVKPASFKIVAVIARQTWGWGAHEKEISLAEFSSLTGIKSITTIREAIAGALEYINQTPMPDKQGFIYSMKLMEAPAAIPETDTVLCQNMVGTIPETDTVLCQNMVGTIPETDIATSGLKERKEKENKELSKEKGKRAGATKPTHPVWELPQNLNTPEFEAAWIAWFKHLIEKNSYLTQTSGEVLLTQLSAIGPERATAAILHSINRRWLNVYEPDAPPMNGTGQNGRSAPAMVDVAAIFDELGLSYE